MWTVEPLFNLLFWVPLGKRNSYADAAWGNSAQDNAPGGTFGTFFGSNPGNVNESNFVFLLKQAMYLLTGSKRTSFTQNINEFTMMPSYSSADLRFPNKNLYMKWDDQYLCGRTPFDYVYAPPQNEQHVFVSATGSQWFENEVRCDVASLPTFLNPAMTGNSTLCSTEIYSITSCKPGINITWTATPAGIVSISGSGSQVTVTKISNGRVILVATVSSCNNNYSQTVSKTIDVGTVAPTYIEHNSNDLCQEYHVSTNYFPDNTYTWSFFKQPYGGNLQEFPNSGSTKRLNLNQGSGTYNIGVTTTNTCGTGSIYFISVDVDCDGGGHRIMVTPNPAKTTITVSYNPNEKKSNPASQPEIREMKIMDRSGNIHRQYKFGAGIKSASVSIAGLKPEVYILGVFDGEKWINSKFIVE